jgi:hypothetical protein
MYPRCEPVSLPQRENKNAPKLIFDVKPVFPDTSKIPFKTASVGTQTDDSYLAKLKMNKSSKQ